MPVSTAWLPPGSVVVSAIAAPPAVAASLKLFADVSRT